ncbi:MAG: bifunctional UDP-N-acetylglucosamine diphosphorylase/glucosamine-1-phosphate N-acetyltransferase GlmU [Rhodospirillales bacterium]|nr:bifunctional UDP-N-acetylglucosamine diphosphorylase/glucosamine-1-phosphate N-acetyltransferase GlmU [Rhodospirillales bacterium]
MTTKPLAVVILAAGRGSRMKSDLPKVMHPLAGRPMVSWLLDTVESLTPNKVVVVAGPDMADLGKAVESYHTAIQNEPKGTGDAVKAALPELKGFEGDVLILMGDAPLIGAETLRALIETRHKSDMTKIAVLGMKPDNPAAYGRMVLNADGSLEKIVEFKDATVDERNIKLCNAGVYCVDGRRLADWLGRITNDNAQGEYYLTDLVEIAAADGAVCHVHVTEDPGDVLGVNSRADLAALERIVQQKLRVAAMDSGATLIDPETTYFSWDTKLGRDVLVEPNVFFGPDVEIGDGVHIKAFCHLEGTKIAEKASVGPFARLRPGAEIGTKSKIGNFVEIKSSLLHEGVKAGHHAYIGNAEIGAGTNYSCGAITANYDGKNKHKTTIGKNAFIGSDVTMVAPVTIGDNAFVAAGSTITKDVPAEALAVAREKSKIIEGWVTRKRKGTDQ